MVGGNMKIHNVAKNKNGIDYCIKFHNKTVAMVKNKIKTK